MAAAFLGGCAVPGRLAVTPAVCSRAPRSRTALNCAPTISETTDDGFKSEVLSSEVPVLVDFYAQWCGPCKLLNPVLDIVHEEYGENLKVLKLDTDKNTKTVEKYQISALPTLILFESGQVKSQIVGAVAKARIQEFLKQNI